MRKVILDIIFFTLLSAILIFMMFGFLYIKGEATQCLKNPYVYGARKMGSVECSCVKTDLLCPANFYFNETSFRTPTNVCGESNFTYSQVDYSKYFNFTG